MKMNIALVNMPFGFHIYPSIQLGTLTTLLKAHGYRVKNHYLNLHFAQQLGFPIYNELCEKRNLIGEWLFSHPLFGDKPKNIEYVDHFGSELEDVCRSIDRSLPFLLDVKTKMVPEYLDWAVNAIDWSQYSVVGFSSTFNQNLASVTLAKWIKEKYPKINILFGGSNFDSEMGVEYFRCFDWIDYVVQGEAEHVLPALMNAIENSKPIPKGVVYRKNDQVVFAENNEMFSEFHQYGPPDYDDFFAEFRAIDPNSPSLENPIILYETARGCWWGEKHHCTFCGLNASTMKFRARPIEQVHAEMAELSKRYDTFRFRIVDNILELKYIDGVFEKFAQENFDFQIFIEVKSNLTKPQIKSLAHGGVNVVQPGIESFSAQQLLDMDKGVHPMQNILFLKWAMYYGIDVEWNILTGFPGEKDEDYRRQIGVIEQLFHLQPPIGVGNLWLERFSPYFTRPEEYGIKILGPGEAYPFVYASDKIDSMKIAYDFQFESGNKVDANLIRKLRQTVADWRHRQDSEQTPFLFFTRSMNFVTVYDGRKSLEPEKIRFQDHPAWIISFCNEKPRTMEKIQEHIRKITQSKNGTKEIEEAIQDLQDRKIIYEERGKYFTLALPHNAHY